MVATWAMIERMNRVAGVKKVLPLYPLSTKAGPREPSPKGPEEEESGQEPQSQSGGSSA